MANKIGLVLSILYGLFNVPSVVLERPSGDEPAPPMGILWADTILGVLVVVTAIAAWRTRRRGYGAICAAMVAVLVATTVPAFFVDIPASVKVVAAVTVVVGVLAIVLMLVPAKPTSDAA